MSASEIELGMNFNWSTYRCLNRVPRSYVVWRPSSVSSPSWHTPSTSPPGPAATMGPSSSPKRSSRRRHCRLFHWDMSSGVFVTDARRWAAAGHGQIERKAGVELVPLQYGQYGARPAFWKRADTGARSPWRSITCTSWSSRFFGYSLSSSSCEYGGRGLRVVMIAVNQGTRGA
jgi:hypothetical protein